MNNESIPTSDHDDGAGSKPAGAGTATKRSTVRRLSAVAIAVGTIAAAVAVARYGIAALFWPIAALWLVQAVVLAVRMRMGPAQSALAREFRRAVRQLRPDVGYINADTGQMFTRTSSRTLVWKVDQLAVAHAEDVSEAQSKANLRGDGVIAVTWQEYWTAAGSGLVLTAAQGGVVDEHPDGTLTPRPGMPRPPLQRHIRSRWQLAHRLVADEADVRAVLSALRGAHPRDTDTDGEG